MITTTIRQEDRRHHEEFGMMNVIIEMIMIATTEMNGVSETNAAMETLLRLAGNHVAIDLRISLMITPLELRRQCQNRQYAPIILMVIVHLLRRWTTEIPVAHGMLLNLKIMCLVDLFARRHHHPGVANLMMTVTILVPLNILVQAIIVEMTGTTTSTIRGQARCRRQHRVMIAIIDMTMIETIRTIDTVSGLDLVTGMMIGVIAEVMTGVICTISKGLYRNQREARCMMTTAVAPLKTGAMISVTCTMSQGLYRNQREAQRTMTTSVALLMTGMMIGVTLTMNQGRYRNHQPETRHMMIAGATPMSMKGILHQGPRLHNTIRGG
jgi:hypothetical protein